MPFFQAAAAAGRGGVLGDEHRVFAHGCLFAVVGRFSGCEALFDKVAGVLEHDVETFAVEILSLGAMKPEALAKC